VDCQTITTVVSGRRVFVGVVTQVLMPQMGLEVTEGTVVSLHVAEGATVAEGDVLLQVETDKALTDVPAPHAGVVLGLEVEEGDTIAIGATLVRLGDRSDEQAEQPEKVAEPAGVGAATPTAAPSVQRERGAHAVKAAPVARRAARHHGLDLASIAGTGPRGRITLRDVEQALATAGNGSRGGATPPAAEELEALSATRRAIARRMTESQRIPQFALQRDIDATWLLAEKSRITDAGSVKVGVNDLLVQALGETVTRHPALASSYVKPAGDAPPQLRRCEGVDVGLAVATDRGLLVPVIRRAHERGLGELALERDRLVARARAGKLTREDMTGATVSLSSLAAFGVDRFTAMLNPGESAILAIGRPVDRVVPSDRGIAVVPTLTLTLTVDHRVVDGATGARALAELADLLGGGMTWRT
jgi:pyruvate dehydrogenase E2 component (dihydrolipoamide acetyltransferase)